jgi:hypothetical protein
MIPNGTPFILPYTVQATVVVHKGTLVGIDTATGYLVMLTNVAARRFSGVSEERIDGTSAVDVECNVYKDGAFRFAATSITALMHDAPMYVVDNETFDDTTTQSISCGILVNRLSNTEGWIDIGVAAQLTANATNIVFADGGAYTHVAALTAVQVDAALEELNLEIDTHIINDGAGGTQDPGATKEHIANAVVGWGTGLAFRLQDSGAGIVAMTTCRPNGYTGGIPDVLTATNTVEAPGAFYCPTAIGAGAAGFGYKTYTQENSGVNTGAAAAEDPVYRGAAGAPTLTRPTTTAYTQVIGRVLTVAADGEIQYDMDDIKYGLHTHTNNAEGGAIPMSLLLHEADVATGWTKNGTPQSCPMQDAELPVAVTVVAAFATLQTVSGHAAGVVVALNGSALFTIAQNAHVAEDKALSIAVAANTDFDITCNENIAGAGADLKITLIYYVTP